ncbi:hypothetical protein T03_2610 [Trichinella britovi]|uniref:Uncharacterized protein n=1 Tax=Trichinella britovi TaxID=45882 RepID=A0A0V1CHS5_TRIBR|nr:hypothetical protein T03_2610 [Trichinella britovi]
MRKECSYEAVIYADQAAPSESEPLLRIDHTKIAVTEETRGSFGKIYKEPSIKST